MNPNWKSYLETIANLLPKELSAAERDRLLYREWPNALLDVMTAYFRLEVEGDEHLPRSGPGILTPNHSGFAGFDAMILNHEVQKRASRKIKVLTHFFWFMTEFTSAPAQKLGFVEATLQNGLDELGKRKLIAIFPEGEMGNFKPSTRAYRLQEFKRGFVRMALTAQAPIIPTLIIGAEESHLNLKRFRLGQFAAVPLPLNIIPLPAKWKIRFLPPIRLPFKPEAADDVELVHEIAADVRERMQVALNAEIKKRRSAFF